MIIFKCKEDKSFGSEKINFHDYLSKEERVALCGVEASSSEEVIKIAADELYKRGIVKEDF